MASPIVPERRAAHRFPVQLPAYYSSDDVAMAGLVSNLSRSGAFLRSDYLDRKGSQVTLVLALADGHPQLTVSGTVARVDEGPDAAGMGIRFTDLSATTRLLLANFVINEGSEAPS